MITLPCKDIFLNNFLGCKNWEEKYLYIIELGNNLPSFPNEMYIPKYLINECQSKVWIYLKIVSKNKIILRGDSDAAIVRGLIAILIIIYDGMTLLELINYDIKSLFNKLSIDSHLTYFRIQGLEAIIKNIRNTAFYNLELN